MSANRYPKTSPAACVLSAGAIALLLGPAHANHPLVSLSGSDFEIDVDANIEVDDAGLIDWASVSDVVVKNDAATGQNDDSFGQGAKEDTQDPAVVTGSIPPNKSDLKTFGVYLESNGNDDFLHLFWTRVQDPTGTTNMDFELNQSDELNANAVTRKRTPGDLLIQYDLAHGGTDPELLLSKWVDGTGGEACEASNKYPCWGTRINLTGSGDATGSINASPIPGGEGVVDGQQIGPFDPRTFGEATIDFAALVPDASEACTSFGSAFLKSRSSDSFTSALKDFIAPAEVNISNCGAVTVNKTGDGEPDFSVDGAVFVLLDDGDDIATYDGQVTYTDPSQLETFFGSNWCVIAGNECSISNVFQGSYEICEAHVPDPYTLADPRCQGVEVTADHTVERSFHNLLARGAIKVVKTRKHAGAGLGADHPHPGVTFEVTGDGGSFEAQTGGDGIACFEGLLPGTYEVTETVPGGYDAVGIPSRSVDVVPGANDCGDNSVASASFQNVPLTDISVSVDSQVDGGTVSSIVCEADGVEVGSVSEIPNGVGIPTMSDNGDISLDVRDLVPGTVTCTIVIDP